MFKLFSSFNLDKINFIKFVFLFFGSYMFLVGIIVNWFEKILPTSISTSYKYGKLSKQKLIFKIDYVPKSWFRHFYVLASIFSLSASLLLFLLYFNYIHEIPEQLRFILALLNGSSTKTTVSASASFFAIILMTIHCCRRFYETHFVSVYSDSKMNIGIYFVGLLHYFGAILGIISEAPGVLIKEGYRLTGYDLTFMDLLGASVFLWANKTQFEAAVTLAQLRKNETGKIISSKHHIPRGKFFDLVSCPHMMCEIVIYLCLWTILWGNTIWPYIIFWVIVNQVECALLCHWWYQETFKNYPQERKAVIPFIL